LEHEPSLQRSYRYRIYPDKQQTRLLEDTIETCRHLYNDSLGERSKDWDVNFWNQKQLLVLRKQDNKYYKQVHSQVLQDVLLRLDKAYQAFFKKLMNYPRFKRYGKYNSFTYPQYGGFRFKEGRLVLSCIGSIEIMIHRIPIGRLKRCTVVRDVGEWYCCITADDGVEKQESKSVANAVGIDMGLLNWITLSNGDTIKPSMNVKAEAKKIKQLQRELSRKKDGSHNKERARINLAKAWQKVRRRREDFVHKTSKQLAELYDAIIFEKLNIGEMVKNHNLAQTIMEATWGKLRLIPTYKVERRGGRVIVVNPNGTSQKCSNCGEVVKKDLSIRTHECICGLVIDRDYNAALNILTLGLEQTFAEKQPLLVQPKRISKFASRKHEAHVLRRG